MKWNLGETKGPDWPKDDEGNPAPPAFLVHISGGPLNMELTLNLLEAYGIPHFGKYPHNGLFGKLILGFAPFGMEVYVPETMLEDAHNILNAEIIYDDEDKELLDE